MMSIKPFVLATLPAYLLVAGMLGIAVGVYELSLAIFGPFPEGNPGPGGLVFFTLFSLGVVAECLIFSRLNRRYRLHDTRVELPRNWRSVILDTISWSSKHPSSEPLFVIGMVGVLCAISEAVIYGLTALHTPAPILWILGLAGLFVVFFLGMTCQVLINSTIHPVGGVSAEEFAEIYEKALPKLRHSDIELLKKRVTFVPSPKAFRIGMYLFGVALLALPIAMAESYMHQMYLALPISYIGGAAAVIGIALMGFPISGKKVSELSRRLQGTTEENGAD